MSSELVWAVWSDGGDWMGRKGGGGGPLTHTRCQTLTGRVQRQLNGLGVKLLQNMLGWERLGEPWWPCSGSHWLGLLD